MERKNFKSSEQLVKSINSSNKSRNSIIDYYNYVIFQSMIFTINFKEVPLPKNNFMTFKNNSTIITLMNLPSLSIPMSHYHLNKNNFVQYLFIKTEPMKKFIGRIRFINSRMQMIISDYKHINKSSPIYNIIINKGNNNTEYINIRSFRNSFKGKKKIGTNVYYGGSDFASLIEFVVPSLIASNKPLGLIEKTPSKLIAPVYDKDSKYSLNVLNKLRITDKNKNIFTPSNKNIKRNTNTMESMEIEEKVLIEANLSTEIVKEVEGLENIIFVEHNYHYYNIEEILIETYRTNISIQNNDLYDSNIFSYLSLVAQSNSSYDNAVVSIAGGKLYEIAKKANIHILAIDFYNNDEINALEYIVSRSVLYKTIINISKDCCFGNKNLAEFKGFSGYENTIPIGSLSYSIFYDIYKKARDVAFPPFFNSHKFKNLEFDYGIGTSVSAPIIEGIAATIITNILLVINLISG
ncbi:hypothetical protein U3516DRAFT_734868 [Neocallimastix sp. 'constans']